MLSSDMPELQSTLDIGYIKTKLAVDESDEKAKKYFEGLKIVIKMLRRMFSIFYFLIANIFSSQEQFDRVIKLSFTTKIDWCFHAINKKKQN